MVQGMEILEDSSFVFTTSFTYLMFSKLLIYQDVLKEKPDTYTLHGNKIPYYHFTSKNLLESIYLPPMAEGFFTLNSSFYILFESSADSYSFAYPKLKSVIEYKRKNKN